MKAVASSFASRFGYGIEYRNSGLEHLTVFSGRYPRDHVSSILHALAGMKSAGGAGDSLDQEPRVFID